MKWLNRKKKKKGKCVGEENSRVSETNTGEHEDIRRNINIGEENEMKLVGRVQGERGVRVGMIHMKTEKWSRVRNVGSEEVGDKIRKSICRVG